jgi:hypothetical protein
MPPRQHLAHVVLGRNVCDPAFAFVRTRGNWSTTHGLGATVGHAPIGARFRGMSCSIAANAESCCCRTVVLLSCSFLRIFPTTV